MNKELIILTFAGLIAFLCIIFSDRPNALHKYSYEHHNSNYVSFAHLNNGELIKVVYSLNIELINPNERILYNKSDFIFEIQNLISKIIFNLGKEFDSFSELTYEEFVKVFKKTFNKELDQNSQISSKILSYTISFKLSKQWRNI